MTTQIDLTGSWLPLSTEDVSNDTYPVDYMALPLSDEGRVRALSYNESQLSMIDRQCEGRPVWYFVQGPFGFTLWRNTEPTKGQVTSSHDWGLGKQAADDYLDGRAAAALEVRGALARRLHDRPLGGQHARRHDDQHESELHPQERAADERSRDGDDQVLPARRSPDRPAGHRGPVHLAEPYTITKTFERSPTEITTVGPPCISTFEGTALDAPAPHWNPDKNPFVDELTKKWGIPREVVLGYPETLYPDYRQKLKNAR